MMTRRFGNEITLFAIFGICAAGCTIKANNDGSGGSSSGSGGSSSGSGGSSSGSGGSSSGSGGSSSGSGGSPGQTCAAETSPPAKPASGSPRGPCDIYADDGGPCVAAHSTVRALFATYDGPLYQVRKSDGSKMDIKPMSPGGWADSAAQDTFCDVDACYISTIYDQSGKGNHLTKSPPGMAKATPGNEANAKSASAMFGNQKVYGVHVVAGVGYRNNTPCGTATGDNPETEYMVVAAGNFNSGCCFDYGNMETSSRDDGEGTMEAVYFGNCTIWNTGGGKGPWVMGDLENGLWAGNTNPYNDNATIPDTYQYVIGMVKGDDAGKNHWTIKKGDAQSGSLMLAFDGHRPSDRYNPMKKQGAIGLGTGGDNTNNAKGDFFEGVMTAKYSSDKADDDVQANVVAAYGAK
jgi:hypothetical protein